MSETWNFDIKLIEEVKNVPALSDSHMEEYKLADRKLAIWVQIADKFGSSAGIIIATTLAQYAWLHFSWQWCSVYVQVYAIWSVITDRLSGI